MRRPETAVLNPAWGFRRAEREFLPVDEAALEASPVVANCRMNRERRLDSYREELKLDPVAFLKGREAPSWLDLCCGHGRALAEAARELPGAELVGVDLVDTFVPAPGVRLIETPLRAFEPGRSFALITCVHGLHYLADKLGMLARACSWLEPDGLLLAHLDLENLRWADGARAGRSLAAWLRSQNLSYHDRMVRCRGRKQLDVPFEFERPDDQAGPNYTGQAAVHSLYRRPASPERRKPGL